MVCPHCGKLFKPKTLYKPGFKLNKKIIKNRMKKIKLSQEELGILIGRSRETINRMLNNKINTTEIVINRMANILNIPLYKIISKS